MKNRLVRPVFIGVTLALAVTLCFTVAASAFVPVVPLYPPGPPYSRLGPGGMAPNFWSASGHGNPQFFMTGGFFWWQNPPPPDVILF